jgi:hypothetical protein
MIEPSDMPVFPREEQLCDRCLAVANQARQNVPNREDTCERCQAKTDAWVAAVVAEFRRTQA